MDNTIFEDYFKRTVWRGKDAVPSYDALKGMENAIISKLFELKESDYQTYRYCFSFYGKQLIRRISFCRRNNAVQEIKPLYLSYQRLKDAWKSLDGGLYEAELTPRRKSKHQEPVEEPQQKEVKAPFLKTALTEKKASSLYDTLVNGGYLADTGKDDFIYYFTGKGEQPKNTLEWKTDAVILSILAECLSSNRIPWTKLSVIFGGLNIDSMKTNLSRERNKFREGYQQTSYEKHRKMIEEWLK